MNAKGEYGGEHLGEVTGIEPSDDMAWAQLGGIGGMA